MRPKRERIVNFERIVLRNQRYIMLALASRLQNAGGLGSGYHAERLTKRVKDMERIFDWIASPSEKLSEE
jgi:hypothetical protein